MDVAVFLGSSLNLTAAKAILPNATYLAPAKSGDITKLLSQKPRCIVIVDGEHSDELQQEISCALAQGVEVFGGASLGARYAVQLSKLGMRGVGKIFHEYLAYAYDADQAEQTRLSIEALVNIRQTVTKAYQQGVISKFFALELLMEARARCYSESDFNALARQLALEYDSEGQDFLVWLETNGLLNQQSLDVLELLDQLTARCNQ